MKLLLMIPLPVFMLFAADAPVKKMPERSAPAKVSAAPNQIPAGAVQAGLGLFHYTDAAGIKWVYRKTPFGIARWQDNPAAEAAQKAQSAKNFDNVTAAAEGDSISFERPGPFGTYRWTQKKSELDEMERAVWARTRAAGQD